MGLLKKLLPTEMLVRTDQLLQSSGIYYSPSIFVQAAARGISPNNLHVDDIFVSPDNGAPLRREGDVLRCESTGRRWAIRDGIYDFKAPLE
jgi:hypothetical protein